MRGNRAVGEGWQATGCGREPPPASAWPPGFLSCSFPPEPDIARAGPVLEVDTFKVVEFEWAGCPGATGVNDWEEVTKTKVGAGFRSRTAPLVVAPLMGTGAWSPTAR